MTLEDIGKGFAIFYLNSKLIKTIYACCNYVRQNFHIDEYDLKGLERSHKACLSKFFR